jgi:Uncharacterized conserved protein
MSKQYWLLKSEPTSFSIDDLNNRPLHTTHWDGVRNYQARNYMRQMKVKDQVLFYHSNVQPPGVAGIAEIVREAYPDHTAFDPDDKHFDPKSTPIKPMWDMVDVRFVRKFKNFLPLEKLREQAGLQGMELLRLGSRLSVQPVSDVQWKIILKLGDK